MSFQDSGFLVTGIKDDSDGDDVIVWTTETDWKNNQAIENISIIGSYFQLGQGTRSSGAIDDFEHNDLSEYGGSVGSSDVNIQTGTVFEGTYALELSDPNGNPNIYSTSGLPRYPQAGDTFEYHVYFDSSSGVSDPGLDFGFAYQDADNMYFISTDRNGELELKKRDGGSQSTPASDTSLSNFSYDEWHKVQVEWEEGGSITVSIFDSSDTELGSISTVDSTFSEGGIEWEQGNQDSVLYTDFARITDVTDSTGVIDDFEDNDISEYFDFTGNGSWSTQSGTVFEGSYALKSDYDGATPTQRLISTSGLDRYPQSGDTFSFRYYYTTQDDACTLKFAADESLDNYYHVKVGYDDTEIDISKSVDGNFTKMATGALSNKPLDEWCEVIIDWTDSGDIDVTINDQSGSEIATDSTVDNSHNGGGIGFDSFNARTSSTHYFDIAEITASSDTSETGVVDDFEDNSLSEYSGDTGSFNIQTSNVKVGTYALESTSVGNIEASESGGLPRTPRAGDTFEYYVRNDNNNGNPGLIFGGPSVNIGYLIKFPDLQGSEFEFEKVNYNTRNFTDLIKEDVSLNTGEWYKVRCEWAGDGTFTIIVEDDDGNQIVNSSAVDTEYTGQGVIGWRADPDNPSYWDDLRIVE